MPVRTIFVANGNAQNDMTETDKSSQPIKTKESRKPGSASTNQNGGRIFKTFEETMERDWGHKSNVHRDAVKTQPEKDTLAAEGHSNNQKTGSIKMNSVDNITSQSDVIGMRDFRQGVGLENTDHLAGKKKTQANKKKTVVKTLDNKALEEADAAKARHHLPARMKGMKKCIHVMLFLFIFGNDVADFVSDWLFFVDVVSAEKGMVYGPPEPAAVWCLLLFSIIGTFTFIFECSNMWWEFFRNNPWMDSDWLSAIVIWIEDIPQVLISLYLALCREEPISVFQLTKAAVILIGVVIRIIVTSVKYCNKEAVKSHHHIKIKIVIMLGVILEACCAVAIFFLTQTERGNSGEVAFKVPSTVVEETYNDQRYFTNVGIFFHSAESFDVGNLDPNKTDYVANWIHLTSVTDLRQESHGGAPSYKVDYGYSSSSIMNLAISEKRDAGNWTLSECYEIDIINTTITDIKNTTCLQHVIATNITTLIIKLWYEHPGSFFKTKVFGDIHMDIHKLQNGVCSAVTQWDDSIENSINGNVPLTAHYYRTRETLDSQDIRHLLYQSGVPRFYQNIDSNMLDARVIWKTGWNECSCNGNVAPVLDTDQSQICS